MQALMAADPTVARNADILVDQRVGVVKRVDLYGGSSSDFVHAEAETCDPQPLGGAEGPFEVAGTGLQRAAAADSALRRAVARYCAALYQRDRLPLLIAADAGFPIVPPSAFALQGAAQYERPGSPWVPFDDRTPTRWTGAIDLASGGSVHVPATFVWLPYPWLRRGGDLPIAEATATGLACASSIDRATLAALLDVVRVDAVALFWQTAMSPPQVNLATLTDQLRALVARFESRGAKVAILDVTTNNRIPVFVAVASTTDIGAPAWAFGSAAEIDPEAAIAAALVDLAGNRKAAERRIKRRPAPSPTNDWEDVTEWADHLMLAADHANRNAFAFVLASDDRRDLGDYESAGAVSAEAALETVIARVIASGHRPFAANLTSEDIGALGLSVIRVLVPGYQPLFARHQGRALGGNRLYDVPQKLGHRGISRGGSGNAVPHPFAADGPP